jgi:hypothetical protein
MSNLKPIATRPGGGGGDPPPPPGGRTPASSSGVVTPKGRAGAESESPAANSDASSPWRRFFRAGGASNKGFAPSDGDSFGNGQSPRHLVGFSPRGGGSGGSPSPRSTPRRGGARGARGGGGGDYGGGGGGGGQINAAYPSGAPATAGGAAMMVSLAEELLTKKGVSLKDMQQHDDEEYAETGNKIKVAKEKRPVTKHWNLIGVALFLFYVCAAIYYFVIRATRTLNMGYLGYGVIVLMIEIISSTATIGYGILLVKYSKSRRTKGLPIAKKGTQPDLDNLAFHVRVMVPCYKESVELVRHTVMGALRAPLPKNTLKTVYVCDDGKDPAKEAMVQELNAEWGCLEYVAGRKRDPAGETNGKSNNLNNCLKNVIYKDYYPCNPSGPKIPKHEVAVVFGESI